MTIAICGNFQVVFCTESELAWTLEDMGYTVVRLQENSVSTDTMLARCIEKDVKVFLYIHTHGWKTPGNLSFEDLIAVLQTKGIRTASFHLDLYWGLNKGDKRQDRIGQHAFWKTDVVFTADGGHQDEFAARGVNHVWLPPAVAKRHCWLGQRDKSFVCTVAFVGSKGYHHEYPFRGQLIAWLEKTYAQKFRRFNGDCPLGTVREERLNNLYASATVVVGDSCFAGIPYYWSDRIPETLGRGGFLIHPSVEGLEIPGLVTFKPQDLADLAFKINWFSTHLTERQDRINTAMEYIKLHHTYHNRMQTVLTTLGVV